LKSGVLPEDLKLEPGEKKAEDDDEKADAMKVDG